MYRSQNNITRRGFVKRTLSAAGLLWLPAYVPSAVRGQDAPSNRITLGCIGTGGMGIANLKGFFNTTGCQIVAVCDVDSVHLKQALKEARLPDSAGYHDFRDLLARPDIDAVVVSTPDHWHVPISLAAVRAGKDVYCEKPLTLTIAEGRDLCNAVRQYDRVFQVGSHQRSDVNFRFACELVRNGRIGKIQRVFVDIPANNRPNPLTWKEEPVPAHFDYDMWLGPAQWEPYVAQRCHYNFRFLSDYSGGQMTNWGAHHLDIAQWALGMDDAGPIRISGKGEFPKDGLFDTADNVMIEYTYPGDITMICRTGGSSVLFEGDKGKIYVSREELKTWPESLKGTTILPTEARLYRSINHKANFLECIRTRRRPITDVEIGHRSSTVCHLGTIAMQLGRPLRWDPVVEQFVDDPDANRLLSRSPRAKWAI
jgi:predicted dehydrogenase